MRVLLVEDNPGDARLVQEMLREAAGNFRINVAEKLGTGLKFLASQDVDAVLLDLGLPDSRGLETLAKMRTQFSHLPVVIMTSIDDEALGIQAVQLGAQDYLVKGQVDGRLLRRSLEYALERKRAEAEIMRLSEDMAARNLELESLNKELESFAYSISHDLRAPLRSMDGFSKILLEDYAGMLDERGKDYLRRVRNASLRMDELINDLLDLSRIIRRDVEIAEVNLSKAVRDITRVLKEGEPGRNVEFVIAEGVVVKGDYNLLKLAIENLLENAWKFTSHKSDARIEFGTLNCEMQNMDNAPSNPPLKIRGGRESYDCGMMVRQARHDSHPELVEGQIRNLKSEIVYFVRDNGVGFDMDYADKLFQPFKRLHGENEFPGTGIGLATVYRIIKRLGGRVWAEGKINEGATFYFTLG